MKSNIGFKPIILSAVAFLVACLANSISGFLSGTLGSIPILGFLFKALAFPFKLIGFLKIPALIVLIVLLILKFIVPLFKKIGSKIKSRKYRKTAKANEEAILSESLSRRPNTVSNSSAPQKMDVW